MRDERLPRWAPRVAQHLISRLYENDARQIYDSELIDEVGYALLARCESFLAANRARKGDIRCPWCQARVEKQEHLQCACGWALPWADYFRTIQHKQLSGAEPVLQLFEEYVRSFDGARSLKEKVLLIDRLIHGFHRFYKSDAPTRPVAVNLIEGRLGEVVAFLDELSAGETGTPGTAETRAEWERGIAANAHWYPSRRGLGSEP